MINCFSYVPRELLHRLGYKCSYEMESLIDNVLLWNKGPGL